MIFERNYLEKRTKRELVELLLAEVNTWPGDVPLAKARREQVKAVLMLLGRCRLWLGETHWLSLCEIWVERSRHPDAWLREFWLQTLWQWLCFLNDIGFEADSLPDLTPPLPEYRPTPYEPPEPGHLPFGFVRPMIG